MELFRFGNPLIGKKKNISPTSCQEESQESKELRSAIQQLINEEKQDPAVGAWSQISEFQKMNDLSSDSAVEFLNLAPPVPLKNLSRSVSSLGPSNLEPKGSNLPSSSHYFDKDRIHRYNRFRFLTHRRLWDADLEELIFPRWSASKRSSKSIGQFAKAKAALDEKYGYELKKLVDQHTLPMEHSGIQDAWKDISKAMHKLADSHVDLSKSLIQGVYIPMNNVKLEYKRQYTMLHDHFSGSLKELKMAQQAFYKPQKGKDESEMKQLEDRLKKIESRHYETIQYVLRQLEEIELDRLSDTSNSLTFFGQLGVHHAQLVQSISKDLSLQISESLNVEEDYEFFLTLFESGKPCPWPPLEGESEEDYRISEANEAVNNRTLARFLENDAKVLFRLLLSKKSLELLEGKLLEGIHSDFQKLSLDVSEESGEMFLSNSSIESELRSAFDSLSCGIVELTKIIQKKKSNNVNHGEFKLLSRWFKIQLNYFTICLSIGIKRFSGSIVENFDWTDDSCCKKHSENVSHLADMLVDRVGLFFSVLERCLSLEILDIENVDHQENHPVGIMSAMLSGVLVKYGEKIQQACKVSDHVDIGLQAKEPDSSRGNAGLRSKLVNLAKTKGRSTQVVSDYAVNVQPVVQAPLMSSTSLMMSYDCVRDLISRTSTFRQILDERWQSLVDSKRSTHGTTWASKSLLSPFEQAISTIRKIQDIIERIIAEKLVRFSLLPSFHRQLYLPQPGACRIVGGRLMSDLQKYLDSYGVSDLPHDRRLVLLARVLEVIVQDYNLILSSAAWGRNFEPSDAKIVLQDVQALQQWFAAELSRGLNSDSISKLNPEARIVRSRMSPLLSLVTEMQVSTVELIEQFRQNRLCGTRIHSLFSTRRNDPVAQKFMRDLLHP